MSKQGPNRPGQKTFSLGAAREPFETWCKRNGYDERTVFLAGWIALKAMSHDDRISLFERLKNEAQANFQPKEEIAKTAAGDRSGPATSTTSRPPSRRAI